MLRRLSLGVALGIALAAGSACQRQFEGAGELRARKVTLQREVAGLRETIARLERGEPLLPQDDVAVAVEDTLIRDIIAAQLPFTADVKGYHLRLTRAEVVFQESQIVRLYGTLNRLDRPDLAAEVTAIGALGRIAIDESSSTLRAAVALEHVGIEKASGLESVLSGPAMDDIAREVRLAVADQMPIIQIPVKVQPTIDVPAVTLGPVRLEAATLPLKASVSQVIAGRGRLWISIRLQPGDFAKTGKTIPGVAVRKQAAQP